MSNLDDILLAADEVWDAHGVVVSNGGGSYKRHLEPAIYNLQKVVQNIRKIKPETPEEFRESLAKNLYSLFEMRTNQPWENVGEESNYPGMHKDWLEAADELINLMTEE